MFFFVVFFYTAGSGFKGAGRDDLKPWNRERNKNNEGECVEVMRKIESVRQRRGFNATFTASACKQVRQLL